MKPSLKRNISGIFLMLGIATYILGGSLLTAIIGSLTFLIALNFFVDAKIEENKVTEQ